MKEFTAQDVNNIKFHIEVLLYPTNLKMFILQCYLQKPVIF